MSGTVPEMTEVNYAEFCQACRAYFPERDGAYFRICGECWHCWASEQELVDHNRSVMTELGIVPTSTKASEIYSCPCCGHDF